MASDDDPWRHPWELEFKCVRNRLNRTRMASRLPRFQRQQHGLMIGQVRLQVAGHIRHARREVGADEDEIAAMGWTPALVGDAEAGGMGRAGTGDRPSARALTLPWRRSISPSSPRSSKAFPNADNGIH